jgi:O-antigen/teichoic acid export membrane protein
VSLTEVAAAAIYTVDRAILGLFRSSGAVALFEGPVRAHNLVRSLNGATMVTSLPAASAYFATRDERRLRELVLRGCRYTLALAVPIVVTGMVLSGPILQAWLGDAFRSGGLAMAILLSHWLVNACSGVLAAVLVAGGRAASLARYAALIAVANFALALALVPADGVEGAALATAVPYVALFPYLAGRALQLAGIGWAVLVRRALLPAWSVGLAVAAVVGTARAAIAPEVAPAVAGVAAFGLVVGWAAYYLVCMDTSERRLVLSLAGQGAVLGRG